MAPRIMRHACELLAGYDVVFCDVWGVLHDGVTAYPAAGEALARFRSGGGTVVLVSNAPRAHDAVARILDEKHVRRDAWDTIVSSGDLARAYVAGRGFAGLYHVGPRRDDDLFVAIAAPRVPFADADALIVTGLDDDRLETGESYRPLLAAALARGMPLVCANPDLVVHVGALVLPCAGAVAAIYEAMGGEVYWAGKPYRPAYERALAVAGRLRGRAIELARVLAIGDAVRTDIAGAEAFGVDALFVAQGIHHPEVMEQGRIVPERLARLFAPPAPQAIAAMVELDW